MVGTPIARFVTRPSGVAGSPPDLILGSFFRGQTQFQSSRVYEIQDIFGQIVIVDKGDSCIAHNCRETNKLSHVCWVSDAGHILDIGGKHIILTAEEYRNLIIKDRNLWE